MINLRELEFPEPIIQTIENFGEDIIIDNYSFRGANGWVVFGHHTILMKRVALKFYYYSENAHDEVRLLTQVDSPNIINIDNARTVDGNYAFFMTEEIAGGDLDDFISSPVTILRLAKDITRGIICGLAEMHKEDVRLLHRDLKPANILIDENHCPKIADFGSVKRLQAGEKICKWFSACCSV